MSRMLLCNATQQWGESGGPLRMNENIVVFHHVFECHWKQARPFLLSPVVIKLVSQLDKERD